MKKLISFASILFLFLINLSSCKTTNILPEKQKGFDAETTKYVELSTINIKIGLKRYRQNTILKLYGTLTDQIFTVNEIYWFDTWPNGWTEAKFAAKGQIKIKGRKQKNYDVIIPIELEFPLMAKLRIKDSVLIGNVALKTLENRLDRIYAAIDLLKAEEKAFELHSSFINYLDFEKMIGEILFPEKYNYQYKFTKDTDIMNSNSSNYVFADGIKWNLAYTDKVFPEYMKEVRNTGTLYKDWEENMDLFYYLYNWDFFFGLKSIEGDFKKISWK